MHLEEQRPIHRCSTTRGMGERGEHLEREPPRDGQRCVRRRVFADAAPDLDGLELIRQLWEAHPCGEAATKSPEGDEAVAPPAGAIRPGADVLADLFTPEDLERLMTALGRCWSVEA
jgi:hypothetical protein